MNRRLRWIFLGIGSACVFAAVVVFRYFVYANVIMPISLILWAVFRVFMTVDQEFYWVALIFIAFIFGLRLIPVRAKTLTHPAGRKARQPAKRLEFWQGLIDRARHSGEDQLTLRKNLQDLLINTMANEDQADPNAIRDDIKCGRLDVPKEIFTYLSSVESGGLDPGRPKQSWISRLLSRNEITRHSSSGDEQGIGAVLDFLESYTEIGYDNEYHSKN